MRLHAPKPLADGRLVPLCGARGGAEVSDGRVTCKRCQSILAASAKR